MALRLLIALWLLVSPAWADGLSAPIAAPHIGQSTVGLSFPPQSSGVCSQATTFLARTSGLSGTQTTAYQNLICGMVTDGTWSLMDALYVFATNTTTTANLNLVSTSFTLTTHGTETFSANNGYTGDGSTGYFDTGFNAATAGGNFSQNSASIGACVLTSRTASQAYASIGNTNGSTYAYIQPASGGVQFDLNGSTFPGFGSANAQGSLIASRTTSSAIALYQNGSSVATPTDASLALASQDLYVGGYNSSGTAQDFSADQIAYAIIGGGLSSTQAGNVYSRLHTFLVAVGASSGC
jgi:hypothetical protein